KLGIPGAFSVENALAAIGLTSAVGLELAEISEGLAAAKGVLGRAEVVPVGKEYTVMIDYAHSPDSLENILTTVKGITEGRVIVVFGCGGDRDKTKRPQMGRIAECLADYCVVTSDNPRTEVPETIIAEIVAGMKKNNHCCVENRREAIGTALDMARAGDFVLIAGKGQEMYQEIMGVKHTFDERVVIREHLAGKEGGNV
ncbi:MAG: UDP-N-acetylmuramoyl-L-alanyl-D-glutamate--2,6-diaminopimelate ligase, partial [Clostridia bacterium]|nr:UDP-N-acetylmuramoyl-L-alanyl-D-glutamate--2,6-diaminopimelate ligase [Clostridia bacterium]